MAPAAARPLLVAKPGEFTGGNAILSSLRPGKIDVVASEVTINSWLGDVRLDLVDSTFASREITLNVGGLMCDVRIRVPEGVDVNVSRLSSVMSDAKVEGTIPRPDGIRINLVGTVVMGEVKVLGPDTTKRNKYEKFVK
ncbi:cell wall-active antibiotics response protein [Tessaracoccus coleopterorum]|uniref:cell wall-active antibiotics response protein n=1 Tax=Tessaracoccus coleopterorum TaxID=2714950 RepID=UPI001E37D5FD|nr:cell wall-active antibiotics response protein [Tessaracoccus coleopterorum]